MEFVFLTSPYDPKVLKPQISRALEKRTELLSREQCPGLWKITDKLRAVEKVSEAVKKSRRKRRSFLGFCNWVLGLFLLIPGILEPEKLRIPLLAGAIAVGAGMAVLWRNQRKLFGICSLILGTVLMVGTLGNQEELGSLLILAIAHLAVGLLACLTRRKSKQNPFDRAADQLLENLEKLPPTQIVLDSEGIQAEKENLIFYQQLEWVIEEEDILLLCTNDRILVLQKRDLAHPWDAFQEFLQEQCPSSCHRYFSGEMEEEKR